MGDKTAGCAPFEVFLVGAGSPSRPITPHDSVSIWHKPKKSCGKPHCGFGVGWHHELVRHFAFPCEPAADPRAVVAVGNVRVSVLKAGIIRIEAHPEREFEDRPSQHFWNRRQPVPEFHVSERDGALMLETEKVILSVPLDGRLCAECVRVAVKPGPSVLNAMDGSEKSNLGGCLRTLDTVRGCWDYKANETVSVAPGLMAKDGWTWVDDSATLVFDEAGLLRVREGGGTDWYIFASGRDYAGGLRDYYDVAGHVPLLPKWALGIWWSRWEPYKQSDLERIVGEFDEHGVPLSVCVVDMDWHLPGWTGYTWNREFFPDPRGFFERLHAKGVRACMNLHPAGGVASKEAAYEAMAVHMGMDPSSRATVPFDITDPKFIEGYFKFLHHPLEADGVDFWWMDWQQGTKTTMPGLDPLWYLNHLHALDLARDGAKRPLAFSRWGGWGSHRYPVGFSGDSSRTWKTLEFEIELTAQSANTGFGWWSHDIGGFCDGFPDDELYVRWVQFGALSPIFRFHNCGDPTLDYRPWSKEEKYREASLSALKLRRSLVPYLYTAARTNHLGGTPPCAPMYFGYPESEESYHCRGQYLFGPSLLAAPVATSADQETGLACKVIWLPPGGWYDFSDGCYHEGGRWTSVHRGLGEIPLFARAGSAVPIDVSGTIEWVVFPGTGESELYDDNGTDMACEQGDFSVTRCRQRWTTETAFELRLDREGGFESGMRHVLRLRGFGGQRPVSEQTEFRSDGNDWVSGPLAPGGSTVLFTFDKPLRPKQRWSLERFWKLMHTFNVNCHVVRQMKESGVDFAGDIQRIAPYRIEFTEAQMRMLVSEAIGCGVHWRRESRGQDFLVWWNHAKRPDFTVRLSRCEWLKYHEVFDRGDTPGQMHVIAHKDAMRGWKFRANFADLAWLEGGHDKTGRPAVKTSA